MAKKILALCVSVLMVMSVFCVVPVSAEIPDNLGADYVPGEVTGNLLRDENGALITGFTSNAGSVISEKTWSEEEVIEIGYSGAVSLSDTANATHGAYGMSIPKTDAIKEAYTAGGAMIFACNMCSTNSNTPKANFGFYQQSYPSIMPMEYPSHNDGLETIGYCVFQDFEATVVLPEQRNAIDHTLIAFGFANGEAEAKCFFVKKDSLYFGAEYAYDIGVTADSEKVTAGGTFTVDADIYNQLKNVGTFAQDVKWYALNANRTQAVDGFTFAEGKDGKATVTVDSSVAAGEYTIVAVADANAELVKGVKVAVENIDLSKDYEAGEIKNTNYFSSFSNTYAVSYSNDGTTLKLTTSGAYGDGVAGAKQDRGVGGAGVGVTSNEFWVPGNTIVFGAKAKAVNGTPRVNFAVWQASFPALLTVENPTVADGTPVTSVEYEQIGFSMPIPATGTNDSGNIILGFGFAETPAGQTEGDRSVQVDVASAYLGIEEVYDIDVTADNTNVFVNKPITVDADILNQVGVAGTLNQGVTWVPMNANRTETVDGFTIVEGENGTATVSVDETVEVGEYYLVAVADADSKLIKGIKVTVPDLTQVYEAGEVTGDLIADSEENWSTDYSTSIEVGTKGDTGEWYALYSSTTENVGNNVYGVSGCAGINLANLKTVAKSGDTIVFGALVDGLYDSPTISASMRGKAGTDTLFPVEYNEGEGFSPVYGGGYEQFGVTFKLNDVVTESGNYHMSMRMGFVKGSTTENMEAFTMQKGSMYLGFEYAYDLVTKVTGETTFTEGQGGTFTVDGKVVNQVGSKGTLGQGITWLAMNKSKTALIDDVTISENEDGTISVTVAENAPVGTYKLVAVADDYVNIIKNIDIVVEEEVVPIEGITISATENGITVATDTALANAQLIFVMYEGGKMVAVNTDTKVNLDAQGTQEYTIPAGFTSAKVMLWSADFKPLANVLN